MLRWKRLAVPAVVLCVALVGFGAYALRRSVERYGRNFDPRDLARAAGLGRQVVSIGWEHTSFRWLPRPALILSEVEARVLSGQPGSGSASGRLRIPRVELVPRWDYPITRRLDRISSEGGTLEIGSDLLPQLPRDYTDPLDGTRRPLPWVDLLAIAAAPAATDSLPPALLRPGWRPSRESGTPIPMIEMTDLEIVSSGLEALPNLTLQLRKSRLLADRGSVTVAGLLAARSGDDVPLLIPVAFHRGAWSERGSGTWTLRIGPGRAGLEVSSTPSSSGLGPSWAVSLEDPEGRLADAFLEGRSGALRHLRWSGPWKLRAVGSGTIPAGLRETQITLLSGRVSLDDRPSLSAVAAGTLRVLPGRVDLPDLSLRSGPAPTDTAHVRLEWLRTSSGRSVRGELSGRLNLAWLGFAGAGWSASGMLDGRLGFEGTIPDEGDAWEWRPSGRLEGPIDTLVGPWFAQPLRAGHLSAWAEGKTLRILLVGRWGDSPFRLEAGRLPMPAPRYLGRVAESGAWSFRSPWCRVSDFSLNPEAFPETRQAPFWLLLPGRGSIRIARGDIAGVLFDSLSASVRVSDRWLRVDSMAVRMGQGAIRLQQQDRASALDGELASEPPLRLQVQRLEVRDLQKILRGFGARVDGEIQGELSGSGLVHWTEGRGSSGGAVSLNGAFRISAGTVRGFPIQETLVQWTHLEDLARLSFQDWTADVRVDRDGFAWNRMRLDAPPLRLEGAGRITASREIRGVLSARPLPGGEGSLARALRSFFGEERAAFYGLVQGPSESPDLQLVSRSAFLRELGRVGGSLPPEDAH